jgi:YHS domain-containing protein
VKDPEQYLRQLGVKLTCPVRSGTPAVLGADTRAWVNHEIYFFSSAEARQSFERHPLRYCGKLTDPVTGARFVPSKTSPRFDYGGHPFFFPGAASLAAFKSDPARYATPTRTMPPMAAPAPSTSH